MANKSRSFLKNDNRDFNNILDSVELAVRETSSPTGTTTQLTKADSGKVIFMDASSANTITLPTVAAAGAGFTLKVILTVTGAAGKIVSSANNITGYVEESAANGSNHTLTADTDANTITFVDGDVPGDFIDINCNGSLFFVFGKSAAENKITITQA